MNKEGGVSQLTGCSLRKDQKEGRRIGNCSLGIFALSIQIVHTQIDRIACFFKPITSNHIMRGNKRVIQHLRCLQGRLMAHTTS